MSAKALVWASVMGLALAAPAQAVEQFTKTYTDCLLRNARFIGWTSNEPAEIVVRASFAACRKERSAIPLGPSFTAGALGEMDKYLTDWLILQVIRARSADDK